MADMELDTVIPTPAAEVRRIRLLRTTPRRNGRQTQVYIAASDRSRAKKKLEYSQQIRGVLQRDEAALRGCGDWGESRQSVGGRDGVGPQVDKVLNALWHILTNTRQVSVGMVCRAGRGALFSTWPPPAETSRRPALQGLVDGG